jgi:hypothetical protein
MHTGALKVVQGASLGGREQCDRVVERARFVLGLRRGECALCTAQGLGCQGGGALEERGGGGQAAPCLSPAGRPLELGGNVFVRAGRGLG